MTRLSAAVAVVAALASVSPLLGAVPAVAAEAPLPSALTIKPDARPNYSSGQFGETGYAWSADGGGLTWESYAGGPSKPIEPRPLWVSPTYGSDVFQLTYPNNRTVYRDMKTGADIPKIEVPAGHSVRGSSPTSVISVKNDGKYYVTKMENGTPVTREAVGAYGGDYSPAGAAGLLTGSGAVTLVGFDGTVRPTKAPMAIWFEYQQYVAWGAGKYLVHPRGEFGDDRVTYWDLTKDVEKPIAALDGVNIGHENELLGVVGNDLITARLGADAPPYDCESCDTSRSYRAGATIFDVYARPLSGGPERLIARKSSAVPNMTADGRLVLKREGAKGPEVYVIQAAADGTLSTPTLRDIPPAQSEPTQLALAHGTLSRRTTPSQGLVQQDLSVGSGAVSTGPRTERGHASGSDKDGGWIASGSGDLVRAEEGSLGGTLAVLPASAGLYGSETRHSVSGLQKDSLQARGRYAAYRVKNPDGSLKIQQHSLSSAAAEDVPPQTGSRPAPAFGLGGDGMLWVESTTDGVVNVLPRGAKGKPSRTVDVADCDLTDVQVVGKDLYWKCGTKAAGVFDTVANAPVAALPAHDSALLADGYVAWEKDGNLSVTALRGTPSTRPVGRPADKRPGFGWTVDRFGGALAYVDAGKNIQIVKSGVPAAPMSVVEGGGGIALGATAPWAGRWLLSKPASSWKLTFTHKLTGHVAKTITGKEARYSIGAKWDAVDPSTGKKVGYGAYEWKLTAVPADGVGAPLTVSGTAKGDTKSGPRDLAGNFDGDLLAFTPEGRADVRPGNMGGLQAPVSGSGWTGANAVTAAVPFGDVDRDYCSDVLVRHPSGELRAYLPGCSGVLTPKNKYKVVGGGWNMYDQIVSPGDMIGDSRPDLLAKTPAGDLYLYETYGTEGKFKAKVKLTGGFKGYLLVGGHKMGAKTMTGALVARDPSGKLWRYSALGNGKLAPRVMIGAGGWNKYTHIVGMGDFTNDNYGDLVARDSAGRLWRYNGKYGGTLSSAVDIGGGWNMYKSLH
ncbi:hypothetical protein [Streptomyces sp. TBY4]|uniref:hypothetical protein n=1 Tax=Streptomyces sp. TBY4 TaxID=2962030 RepID=UPI0020B6C78D|nr:hypothetical protein [Streptomyces sp. TBY4]MCP3755341.1 hypothetical protein [Streptomyces sp. TBY4]